MTLCPPFVRKGQIWKAIQQGKLHRYFKVIRIGERRGEMWGKVHRLSVPASRGMGFGQNQSVQRQKIFLGESQIYSAKIIMLTCRLMKCNKLCFIWGIKHCSNAWEIHTLFRKELWYFRMEKQNIQVSRKVCAVVCPLHWWLWGDKQHLYECMNKGSVTPLLTIAIINGVLRTAVAWQYEIFLLLLKRYGLISSL